MTLLKISGEFYFASAWGAEYEEDKLPPSKQVKLMKTQDDFDYALFWLCWHLQDCAEATEVFSSFEECPVCLSRMGDSGHLIHRDPKLLVN